MSRRIEIGFFYGGSRKFVRILFIQNSGFRSRIDTKAVACNDSLLDFLVLSLQGNDINQTEFR